MSEQLRYKKKLRPYEVRRLWISRVILWIVIAVTMIPVLAVLSASVAKGSAFNIWLMKGYMEGITIELSEAAYVDGASTSQILFKIIFSLLKNMIVVIFIFSFITAYSEFPFTSALMKDADTQTLATGLQTFIQDAHAANFTYYSSVAVIASLPIIIISVISQKFISSGLVSGAVKG